MKPYVLCTYYYDKLYFRCKILKWDHEYSYYCVLCELIIKKGDIL